MRFLILFVFLWVAVPTMAAQIEPATLSYQGTLTDGAGQPLAGSTEITVSLYDNLTSDTPFWSEVYTVSLKNGQFSVVLGSDAKPLTGMLNRFNGTTYIGIKVGEDPEMPQRQKLTSVAYAINATNAVNAVNADNGVPKGAIMMWSGALDQIPGGWALCNGLNGTPNLVDRFVVGAGSGYKVGATGGAASHTLSMSEMPSHNHGGGNHVHQTGRWNGAATVWGGPVFRTEAGDNPWDTTPSGNIINVEGGGQPHENRPPYYALAYIMKL